MGEDLTYINVKFKRRDSGNKGDVSYAEVNFKKSETPVPTSTGNPIYSELALLQPTPPDGSAVPTSLDTDEAADKRNEDGKCRMSASRIIAIIIIVTSVVLCIKLYLIVTVSRLRGDLGLAERGFAQLSAGFVKVNESLGQCDERYLDLNSTLELCVDENSRLNLSRQSYARNLSILVKNLSVANSLRSESLDEIKHLKSEIHILNETNSQLCRDVQNYLQTLKVKKFCAPGWKLHKDKCYFISTKEISIGNANVECGYRGAKLAEINSDGEMTFLSGNVDKRKYYWIGGCFQKIRWYSTITFAQHTCQTCWKCEDRGFICQTDALSIPEIPTGLRNICSRIRASVET